ncbi:hypothetical protein B0T16DRAFT_384190 [Cercophora newfieldiana]|uniref:Uncharacterized protein n=1 Tax=Cercophora newfieldiana TaxID=92897 RepID=A0AA40CXQ5_9PEZI|nr:hypothetical protein B0T16DRAFT_384190 [Cercophora newfieldiana]
MASKMDITTYRGNIINGEFVPTPTTRHSIDSHPAGRAYNTVKQRWVDLDYWNEEWGTMPGMINGVVPCIFCLVSLHDYNTFASTSASVTAAEKPGHAVLPLRSASVAVATSPV